MGRWKACANETYNEHLKEITLSIVRIFNISALIELFLIVYYY